MTSNKDELVFSCTESESDSDSESSREIRSSRHIRGISDKSSFNSNEDYSEEAEQIMRLKSVPQKRGKTTKKRPRHHANKSIGKKIIHTGKKIIHTGKKIIDGRSYSSTSTPESSEPARKVPRLDQTISTQSEVQPLTGKALNLARRTGQLQFGLVRQRRSAKLENIESIRIATSQLRQTLDSIRIVSRPIRV